MFGTVLNTLRKYEPDLFRYIKSKQERFYPFCANTTYVSLFSSILKESFNAYAKFSEKLIFLKKFSFSFIWVGIGSVVVVFVLLEKPF